MPNISLEDIVDSVIADPKPIAYLDTCIYLDLIRIIDRDNIDSNNVQDAKELIDNLQSDNPNFWLISCQLVSQEWDDHAQNILDGAKVWIKKLDEDIKRLKGVAVHLDDKGHNLTYPTYHVSNFGSQLFDNSKKLLDLTYLIETVEELSKKASDRVINNISPADKGKSEYKDCFIFEHFLHLGAMLRDQGFDRNIFFMTSNFSDYGTPTNPKSDIANDLNSINANYLSNWSWLKSVLNAPVA